MHKTKQMTGSIWTVIKSAQMAARHFKAKQKMSGSNWFDATSRITQRSKCTLRKLMKYKKKKYADDLLQKEKTIIKK